MSKKTSDYSCYLPQPDSCKEVGESICRKKIILPAPDTTLHERIFDRNKACVAYLNLLSDEVVMSR